MNLKKIILLFLLFIGIKASAQVVPVIPQWRMDTSKDSLSFSIPGMSGSKWIWDSRLLRVRLLNKADSVDWYVTHTALSDTLAGHLAVAKYPVIFIGDTITVDLTGSLSPNAIISGLTPSLFISGPDTSLAISPGQWRINNIIHSKATSTFFHLPSRDATRSQYGYAYADASNLISIVYGALTTTPVPPPIPANTVFVGSVLITPTGVFVGGIPSPLIFQNGLTMEGDTVEWGGNLLYNTTITLPHNPTWLFYNMPDSSYTGWIMPRVGGSQSQMFIGALAGFQYDQDDFLDNGFGNHFKYDSTGFYHYYGDYNGHSTGMKFGGYSSKPNGIEIKLRGDSLMYYDSPDYETALRALGTAIPDMNLVRAIADSVGDLYLSLTLNANPTTVNLNGDQLIFSTGSGTPPLTFDVSGQLAFGAFAYIPTSYAANHTFVPADASMTEASTGANQTLNLPDVSTVEPGRVFIIKRTGVTHTLTIHPFATQTIDGSTSNLSMPNQYDWIEIVGNTTQNGWNIISRNSNGLYVPYTGATANIDINSKSITEGATSGGISAYNTVDQVTNYDRFMQSWQSNFYEMGMGFGGSGTLRGLKLGYSAAAGTTPLTRYLLISNQAEQFDFVGSTISVQTIYNNLANVTFNGASVSQIATAIAPTINQSGNSPYIGLRISPFEQALGSGVHYLIDAGTNSAANDGGTHTSKFTVDDNGNVNAASLRTTAVTFANVPASPVEGMMVAITDSTTATWGATITGGGANHVLGYYDGTNWTVMGK